MEKLTKDKESLVLNNTNLIHWCIKRTLKVDPHSPVYEDLYSEGLIALVKAAIRFDESKGYSFSTYAVPFITGMLQRFYRERYSSLIRPGRQDYDVFVTYNKCGNIEDGAKKLDMDEKKFAMMLNRYVNGMTMESLDRPIEISGDSEVFVADMIKSNSNDIEDMESLIYCEELIAKVLDNFKGTHRDIVEEYLYSILYSRTPATQNYLANKYKVSQAQISRILGKIPEKSAMEKY